MTRSQPRADCRHDTPCLSWLLLPPLIAAFAAVF
jgi:hypothetical protein